MTKRLSFEDALRAWAVAHRDEWTEPDDEIDMTRFGVTVELDPDRNASFCGEGTCQIDAIVIRFGGSWDNQIVIEGYPFAKFIRELVALDPGEY